jgi:hypothetical protein
MQRTEGRVEKSEGREERPDNKQITDSREHGEQTTNR